MKKYYIYILIIILFYSQVIDSMQYLRNLMSDNEDQQQIPNQESQNALLEQIRRNLPAGGNNHIQANVISSGNNTQTVNITVFGFDFLQSVKDLYNKTNNKTHGIFNWIKLNKKKSLFYTFCNFYVISHLRLELLKLYLTNKQCWSFWQQSKTLDELYQIPQSQFSKMLLTDIQQHYTSFNNPTDFVTPLTKFIQDVCKEEKYLVEYLYLCKWIDKLYLGKLYFFKSKALELQIQERMKKLSFMKNTFLAWLTDFKMTQAQRNELHKKIGLHLQRKD